MSQKTIKGTTKLAESIRSRRLELGLTIEEAASRAGVGTKTWCRYETGESIRQDKAKGVCKALNWHTLLDDEIRDGNIVNIDEYKNHRYWSEYISNCFGEAAAISFVVGSEILLDDIEEDLMGLARMPKGSHIGQLDISMVSAMLPEQFLMNYDYDFLYCLKSCVLQLTKMAKTNTSIVARSVMQELALYLIVEEAEFLMETISLELEEREIDDEWREWIFDLFVDMDIVSFLYSNYFLTSDNEYHFDNWKEEQFYTK